jgi:hypothetical protein
MLDMEHHRNLVGPPQWPLRSNRQMILPVKPPNGATFHAPAFTAASWKISLFLMAVYHSPVHNQKTSFTIQSPSTSLTKPFDKPVLSLPKWLRANGFNPFVVSLSNHQPIADYFASFSLPHFRARGYYYLESVTQ